MSPENKVNYYLHIFNNDVKQSIKLCKQLKLTCVTQKDLNYYNDILTILKTKL